MVTDYVRTRMEEAISDGVLQLLHAMDEKISSAAQMGQKALGLENGPSSPKVSGKVAVSSEWRSKAFDVEQ